MTILSLDIGGIGQDGVRPRRNRMVTTDNLSTITGAGYINPSAILPNIIFPTDIFDIAYSYNSATKTGTDGQFTCSISGGVITLALSSSDLVPSDATKTTVASVSGSIVSGNVAAFNDTTGTVKDAGFAATATVRSQSQAATNNVAFTKVITATAAALLTAGKVNVQVHTTATSQFAVLDIKVLKSTGLSGGGGDRLLSVSDGTIVFNNAGITAAVLGTPILTVWGGTGNPLAVGASEVSTAGADIFLQYAGGTTDFTTGSVQVAITLVQFTA